VWLTLLFGARRRRLFGLFCAFAGVFVGLLLLRCACGSFLTGCCLSLPVLFVRWGAPR
jgi:hypothetical protein